MTCVIAEPCVGHKDASCVDVCPVDRIHPTRDEPGFDTATHLHVDPQECIDCDACASTCPFDAIFPEAQLPARWNAYADRNAAHFGPAA